MKPKKPFCLEVCADSYSSAMAAIRGGADRLELCSCLLVGGLTPDPALLEQIRKQSDLSIRCLMRPRFGDFLYDDSEIELMEEQIRRLKSAGADGFVIGCLTEDGELDEIRMEKLIRAAGRENITLHRAFDVCRDGLRAAEQACSLGVDTILTSGQAKSCWEGREYLGRLLEEQLPITIMAGGGINASVIEQLLVRYPLTTFHMSGKKTLQSEMKFRRENVPMGLPGIDEFSIWQTDETAVAEAVRVLEENVHAE